MFAPFKKISFTIQSSFHSQVTNSSDSSPLSSALVMNESHYSSVAKIPPNIYIDFYFLFLFFLPKTHTNPCPIIIRNTASSATKPAIEVVQNNTWNCLHQPLQPHQLLKHQQQLQPSETNANYCKQSKR